MVSSVKGFQRLSLRRTEYQKSPIRRSLKFSLRSDKFAKFPSVKHKHYQPSVQRWAPTKFNISKPIRWKNGGWVLTPTDLRI